MESIKSFLLIFQVNGSEYECSIHAVRACARLYCVTARQQRQKQTTKTILMFYNGNVLLDIMRMKGNHRNKQNRIKWSRTMRTRHKCTKLKSMSKVPLHAVISKWRSVCRTHESLSKRKSISCNYLLLLLFNKAFGAAKNGVTCFVIISFSSATRGLLQDVTDTNTHAHSSTVISLLEPDMIISCNFKTTTTTTQKKNHFSLTRTWHPRRETFCSVSDFFFLLLIPLSWRFCVARTRTFWLTHFNLKA